MSALTVRLPNNVIDEVNSRAKKLHITRSEYIRKSIENDNLEKAQKNKYQKLTFDGTGCFDKCLSKVLTIGNLSLTQENNLPAFICWKA